MFFNVGYAEKKATWLAGDKHWPFSCPFQQPWLHSLFACSREQIRQVENWLKTLNWSTYTVVLTFHHQETKHNEIEMPLEIRRDMSK